MRRRIPLTAVTLVLLAACGTEVAGTDAGAGTAAAPERVPPPPSPEPERPDCPESGLRFTEGFGDATMGLRYMELRLTNCGTEPYELYGYPTVAVLDGDGDPYDIKIIHGTGDITASVTGFDETPRPITLSPGEYAVSGLVWRNTVDDLTRTVVNAERLSIRPDEHTAAQRFVPRYGVDLGTTGVLGTSPWREPEPEASQP
ncbi:DUF4232 domain-containing protein [Streptomyces xiamenensis]